MIKLTFRFKGENEIIECEKTSNLREVCADFAKKKSLDLEELNFNYYDSEINIDSNLSVEKELCLENELTEENKQYEINVFLKSPFQVIFGDISIKCKRTELMKNIFDKYSKQENIDLSRYDYLYNSYPINISELGYKSVYDIANNTDKMRNVMCITQVDKINSSRNPSEIFQEQLFKIQINDKTINVKQTDLMSTILAKYAEEEKINLSKYDFLYNGNRIIISELGKKTVNDLANDIDKIKKSMNINLIEKKESGYKGEDSEKIQKINFFNNPKIDNKNFKIQINDKIIYTKETDLMKKVLDIYAKEEKIELSKYNFLYNGDCIKINELGNKTVNDIANSFDKIQKKMNILANMKDNAEHYNKDSDKIKKVNIGRNPEENKKPFKINFQNAFKNKIIEVKETVLMKEVLKKYINEENIDTSNYQILYNGNPININELENKNVYEFANKMDKEDKEMSIVVSDNTFSRNPSLIPQEIIIKEEPIFKVKFNDIIIEAKGSDLMKNVIDKYGTRENKDISKYEFYYYGTLISYEELGERTIDEFVYSVDKFQKEMLIKVVEKINTTNSNEESENEEINDDNIPFKVKFNDIIIEAKGSDLMKNVIDKYGTRENKDISKYEFYYYGTLISFEELGDQTIDEFVYSVDKFQKEMFIKVVEKENTIISNGPRQIFEIYNNNKPFKVKFNNIIIEAKGTDLMKNVIDKYVSRVNIIISNNNFFYNGNIIYLTALGNKTVNEIASPNDKLEKVMSIIVVNKMNSRNASEISDISEINNDIEETFLIKFNKTGIKAEGTDLMKNIIKKYILQENKDISKHEFIYQGCQISLNNLGNKTVNEIASNSDKISKVMEITVVQKTNSRNPNILSNGDNKPFKIKFNETIIEAKGTDLMKDIINKYSLIKNIDISNNIFLYNGSFIYYEELGNKTVNEIADSGDKSKKSMCISVTERSNSINEGKSYEEMLIDENDKIIKPDNEDSENEINKYLSEYKKNKREKHENLDTSFYNKKKFYTYNFLIMLIQYIVVSISTFIATSYKIHEIIVNKDRLLLNVFIFVITFIIVVTFLIIFYKLIKDKTSKFILFMNIIFPIIEIYYSLFLSAYIESNYIFSGLIIIWIEIISLLIYIIFFKKYQVLFFGIFVSSISLVSLIICSYLLIKALLPIIFVSIFWLFTIGYFILWLILSLRYCKIDEYSYSVLLFNYGIFIGLILLMKSIFYIIYERIRYVISENIKIHIYLVLFAQYTLIIIFVGIGFSAEWTNDMKNDELTFYLFIGITGFIHIISCNPITIYYLMEYYDDSSIVINVIYIIIHVLFIPIMIIYYYIISSYIDEKYILIFMLIIFFNLLGIIIFMLIFRTDHFLLIFVFCLIMNIATVIPFHFFYLKDDSAIINLSIITFCIDIYLTVLSLITKKFFAQEYLTSIFLFDNSLFYVITGIIGFIIFFIFYGIYRLFKCCCCRKSDEK